MRSISTVVPTIDAYARMNFIFIIIIMRANLPYIYYFKGKFYIIIYNLHYKFNIVLIRQSRENPVIRPTPAESRINRTARGSGHQERIITINHAAHLYPTYALVVVRRRRYRSCNGRKNTARTRLSFFLFFLLARAPDSRFAKTRGAEYRGARASACAVAFTETLE